MNWERIAMSRKQGKLRPFVPMRRDMLESPEWRKLSSKAKIIYLYLRYNSVGEIKKIRLPYSALYDMMHPQTISRGFKELQDAGFIKQIFKGGKYGDPAIYDFVGPFADPFESQRLH